MNVWIGTIKENASDGLNKIAGVKLVLVNGLKYEKENEVLILHPTTLEDFEKYYEYYFETVGKEWISDDYKYFLEYVLDPDCEITSTTKLNNFIELARFTKEDDKRCYSALQDFKNKYLKVE